MRLATIRVIATSPTRAYRLLRYGRLPSPRYINLRRAVRELRPRRIVEIGTGSGAGAALMLREASRFGPVEYWGFDLFDRTTPEVAKAEVSAFVPVSLEDVQASLSFPETSVHLIPGDSTLTVPKTDIAPADLVFIDGGHSYRTVKSDWDNIQDLIHARTEIFFDDYTNDVGVREGYGIKQLIDGLDRRDWTIDILQPTDRFRRPAGVLKAQLVRVRAATALALQ